MKSKAVKYLISFTVLLFLALNLVVCAKPNPSPSLTPPKPPPTQPPAATENQPPEEAPPIDEAKNEEEWYAVETFSGEVNYFLSLQDKRDFLINVTAQNLRRWTIIIEDNAPGPNPSPIKITYIHYKGTVYPATPETGCYKRIEPDEYVVIKNLSECYQDITGWVLKNISRPTFPSFTFPRFIPVLLPPGGIIRVYTDV